MALTKTISSTALARLRNIDRGKYFSLRDIVAETKGSSAAEEYETANYLPIDKDDYSYGAYEYFDFLTRRLGTREYGVFQHTLSTYYIAIPNFLTKFKFTPLIKPLGQKMTDYIPTLDKTKFILAADSMFHNKGYGWDPLIYWIVVNQVFINNTPQFATSEFDIGYNTKYIQWKNTPELNFGSVGNNSSNPGSGNAMSSFPNNAGIFNSVLNKEGYAKALGAGRDGKALFAYHSIRDIAFCIVQEHSAGKYIQTTDPFDAQKILESLDDFGFSNALFMDGSSSVFLYEYNSVGGGQFLVNALDDWGNAGSNSKNYASAGLRVAYGIERITP